MELNSGQWAVIIICAFLILGYVRGYYYNRQRARQVLAWMYEGLKTIGPVSPGEKLPGMTTGGRLEVKRAAAPFKSAEAVYLLAPRENPLFWLFHRLQGRGDELMIWLTFQSAPKSELEIARRGDRQLEQRLRDSTRQRLTVSEGPRGLQVAAAQTADDPKLQAFLQRYGNLTLRLSLREKKPHLFLRINLGVSQSESAAELLAALKDVGIS